MEIIKKSVNYRFLLGSLLFYAYLFVVLINLETHYL